MMTDREQEAVERNLAALIHATPADGDWPDAETFVEAGEYERLFGRWCRAEARADRNALWATIGWGIAIMLFVDLLMRWSGSPW